VEWKKGKLLNFERKPTETPGWIWCTNTDDKSCWIPEAWLEIRGKQCRLQRDYSPKELDVEEGDIVQVKLMDIGWVMIVTGDNKTGWIPEAFIKFPRI
jgi:hypothetical protein